jgi:hypothetical protein
MTTIIGPSLNYALFYHTNVNPLKPNWCNSIQSLKLLLLLHGSSTRSLIGNTENLYNFDSQVLAERPWSEDNDDDKLCSE